MKISLFFIIVYVILSRSLFSQNWCLANSVWEYGWSGPNDGTHAKLTYLYDTIIAGNNCNKIFYKETTCGIGWTAESFQSIYTYQQNGVLFIKSFSGNQFDTLFYFDGLIGSKWRRSPNLSNDCSMSYMEITDTGRTVLQGKSIKWSQVYYENHYPIQFTSIMESGTDTIFERFGMKNNLNYILGTHCTNEPIMLRLRCFSDANLNVTFLNEACNYCGTDVGIIEIKKNNFLKVFPNPVETTLNITDMVNELDKAYIIISNSIGQTIQIIPYAKAIDVSMLSPGCYLLKIIFNNKTLYSKFLKT